MTTHSLVKVKTSCSCDIVVASHRNTSSFNQMPCEKWILCLCFFVSVCAGREASLALQVTWAGWVGAWCYEWRLAFFPLRLVSNWRNLSLWHFKKEKIRLARPVLASFRASVKACLASPTLFWHVVGFAATATSIKLTLKWVIGGPSVTPWPSVLCSSSSKELVLILHQTWTLWVNFFRLLQDLTRSDWLLQVYRALGFALHWSPWDMCVIHTSVKHKNYWDCLRFTHCSSSCLWERVDGERSSWRVRGARMTLKTSIGPGQHSRKHDASLWTKWTVFTCWIQGIYPEWFVLRISIKFFLVVGGICNPRANIWKAWEKSRSVSHSENHMV